MTGHAPGKSGYAVAGRARNDDVPSGLQAHLPPARRPSWIRGGGAPHHRPRRRRHRGRVLGRRRRAAAAAALRGARTARAHVGGPSRRRGAHYRPAHRRANLASLVEVAAQLRGDRCVRRP